MWCFTGTLLSVQYMTIEMHVSFMQMLISFNPDTRSYRYKCTSVERKNLGLAPAYNVSNTEGSQTNLGNPKIHAASDNKLQIQFAYSLT